ncbi:GBS Bsp-like repeat-containing protein [Christensenella minuta]|uniref:GBS Bsp-like repeat-containing protein n=1 Tax=Christensenella minuta TaxID=626937 RepID=UPI0021575945|nr:GBS Bsp-like repeat-containing protein [Christensenella minuta]
MKVFKKIVLAGLAVFVCLGTFALSGVNEAAYAGGSQPFTVYLQAGHSPAKYGSGNLGNGVKESTLNEQITSRLYDELVSRGINVIMLNPMTINPNLPSVIQEAPNPLGQYSYYSPEPAMLPAIQNPWKYNSSLTERADLVISLHHNAYGTYPNSANGYEIYYSDAYPGDYGKTASAVTKSRDFAKMIDEQFKKGSFYLAPRSQSVKCDNENNGITKQSPVPSVLIEAGFMTNATDFANMQKGSNQIELVGRIADAVEEYRMKYPGDTTPPTASSISRSAPSVDLESSITIWADKVTDINGVKSVKVAVWSEASKQADLRWFNMNNIGNNNWGYTLDVSKYYKNTGKYYADVYATDNSGNQGLVGGTTFTVETDTTPPKASSISRSMPTVELDSSIRIWADKVTDDNSGVAKVEVAVWSAGNGQADLRWFNMKDISNNNWEYALDISKYYKNTGKYYADVYATDKKGNRGFVGGTTFTVETDTTPPKASSISRSMPTVELDSSIRIWADKVTDDLSGVAKVEVAVWSAGNGQADLRWFNMKDISNNNWEYALDISKYYKNTGKYYADVYATDKKGNRGFVGGTTFVVEKAAGYAIMGNSDVTAEQLANYYSSTTSHYTWNPADYQNMTLLQFCQKYIDICGREGVRPEVAFAQMCLETANLQYGGLVVRAQWNFAGLGATGNVVAPGNQRPNYLYRGDGTEQGIQFISVENGIKSQIQHLKAYACEDELNLSKAPEYDRFGYVTRGCAPTVQALSGKWASSASYGDNIQEIIDRILASPSATLLYEEANMLMMPQASRSIPPDASPDSIPSIEGDGGQTDLSGGTEDSPASSDSPQASPLPEASSSEGTEKPEGSAEPSTDASSSDTTVAPEINDSPSEGEKTDEKSVTE